MIVFSYGQLYQLTDSQFDFKNAATIQIGRDFYFLKHAPPSWTILQGQNLAGIFKNKSLTKPRQVKIDPALVNFESEFIFATGDKTAVEVYSISDDVWIEASPMNKARSLHSGCCLDGKVYVTGGFNSSDTRKALDSIEVFDARAFLRRKE